MLIHINYSETVLKKVSVFMSWLSNEAHMKLIKKQSIYSSQSCFTFAEEFNFFGHSKFNMFPGQHYLCLYAQ